MRDLRGYAEHAPGLEQLARGGDDLRRVVAYVCSDDLAVPAAGRCGAAKLLRVDARHVAYAEGYAEAAAVELARRRIFYRAQLVLRDAAVLVRMARLFAQECVAREHADVHRRALAVYDVEIFRRPVYVDAALAAYRRRDAHAQHAVEYRLVFVAVESAVIVQRVLVHVDVDKTRRDDAPRGVDHLVGLGLGLCDGGNPAVLHQNVKDALYPVRGIEDEAALDQSSHSWCSLHLFALLHNFIRKLSLRTTAGDDPDIIRLNPKNQTKLQKNLSPDCRLSLFGVISVQSS